MTRSTEVDGVSDDLGGIIFKIDNRPSHFPAVTGNQQRYFFGNDICDKVHFVAAKDCRYCGSFCCLDLLGVLERVNVVSVTPYYRWAFLH